MKTTARTNPIHYLIRFMVFIIACMLVIALIVAVCNARKSSGEQGIKTDSHEIRYENTSNFDARKALQPFPN
jgi:hypothetical protein